MHKYKNILERQTVQKNLRILQAGADDDADDIDRRRSLYMYQGIPVAGNSDGDIDGNTDAKPVVSTYVSAFVNNDVKQHRSRWCSQL